MDLREAFEAAGFCAAEPLAEQARRQHLSRLGGEIPAEVEAFYEQCDGGTLQRLSCRAYPLSEAVGLMRIYNFRADIRYLPFFVAVENESDPCMVGLEPPLTGYVFQHCHDDVSRILAPSISSFFHALASQDDDEFFCIEEAAFLYPKDLSDAEQATFDGMMARSMTDLENDNEAQFLVELALTMLTDEASAAHLSGLDHPDPGASFWIKERLKRIGMSDG